LDDYKKAVWKYGKAKDAVESARAGLLLLGESVRTSRKAKDQGRQEGSSSEGNKPCVLNQEFLWPILVEVSAPTRLALRGSHVQRQYRKRTPLRSKSSTIKRLLYAQWSSSCKAFVARKVCTIAWAKGKKAVIWQATNAMYGMGTLKIPLWSICSKEGLHYRLGVKRKEAVRRQATINPIHEFGYPLVIPYLGCTA
jgi:hypothetical protein